LNRAEQDDRASLAGSELVPALAAPNVHDGFTVTPIGNMEHSFRLATNAVRLVHGDGRRQGGRSGIGYER
jgi:hypothetical protein